MFAHSLHLAGLCAALLHAAHSLEAQETTVSSVAAAQTVVLQVEGHPVERLELEAWLLRERGELLAPFYARYIVAERAAAEAAIRLPEGVVLEAVENEITERVRNAFAGDRERWSEELALAERTPAGRIAERKIEMRASLLVQELAQTRGSSVEEVETDLVEGLSIVVLPAILRAGAPHEAVLRIHGQDVMREDYGRWLRLYRGQVLARRFGEAFVITRAAATADIVVTAKEVEVRVQADTTDFVDTFYGGDWDFWRKSLKKEQRTEEDHYRTARASTRTLLLLGGIAKSRRQVSQEDARSAWLERYGPHGARYHLRWIRVDAEIPMRGSVSSDEEFLRQRDEALTQAQVKAEEVCRRAGEGQDFATLAERYSDDAVTAARGGKPLEGFLASQLPQNLQEALSALAVGAVSSPISELESFYVIELLGKESVPFETIKDELTRALETATASKIETAATRIELIRDSEIRVLPAMFAE